MREEALISENVIYYFLSKKEQEFKEKITGQPNELHAYECSMPMLIAALYQDIVRLNNRSWSGAFYNRISYLLYSDFKQFERWMETEIKKEPENSGKAWLLGRMLVSVPLQNVEQANQLVTQIK